MARTATELSRRSDVVLLAQASMAPAAELLVEVGVPVLTTPASAVAEAVRAFVDDPQGRGEGPGPAVTVVPYDRAWPARFKQVEAALQAALSAVASARIEHVGSTSVAGLVAKPVLDIDVIVAAGEIERAVAALVADGYVHRGDLGVEGREAFFAPDDEPARHVYVCRAGGLAVRNHLAVRDVLRRRADLRDEYAAVKLALADAPSMDIETYIAGKTAVLQKVLAESELTPAELRAIREVNDPGDRRQA
ncbi:GrpB family protein [Nocardioides daphniae]|uniref:GrpB family protein n=1 Tax=Nocardioides daphniae TaxID=402297 RepID=UPI001EE79805|nr:GrpB family protein [Nocardioides daphniae]